MSIKEAIERALFGYTSEERTAIQERWVAMMVDRRVEQLFTRLADDESDLEDEEHTPTSTTEKGA